jgi:hypothetical protein
VSALFPGSSSVAFEVEPGSRLAANTRLLAADGRKIVRALAVAAESLRIAVDSDRDAVQPARA